MANPFAEELQKRSSQGSPDSSGQPPKPEAAPAQTNANPFAAEMKSRTKPTQDNELAKGGPSQEGQVGAALMNMFSGNTGTKSVFDAPELNELSLRAFKAGLGGLLEGNPEELQKMIAANYPNAEFVDIEGQPGVRFSSGDYLLNPEGIDAADVARFGVDVAAFTPAGRVTGTGIKALGKGAAVAGGTQTGLQGVEAATGGTFDPEDVAIEAGTQGVFQVAESGVRAFAGSPIARKIKERFKGGADKEPYEAVAEVFKTRKPETIMPEIMADPEILKAANDLGINVNPGVYSDNRIYQEMENALKVQPGSQLSANEKDTVEALARKADDLITEYAGTTDKSAISDDIKDSMLRTIQDLESEAGAYYQTISEVIPKSLKVKPQSTRQYIDGLIEDYGQADDLSPEIKRLYDRLSQADGGVNFALLDEKRKQIGEAAFNNQGPFKDSSKRELKALYNAMNDDIFRTAEFFDLGDTLTAAKAMVEKRKGLEQAAQDALGKDLAKSIMSELGSGVRQLGKGQTKKFDEIISAVPEDMKQVAAVSALNDILAGGSTRSKAFSLSGFTSTYEALQRNKRASQKLFDLIPEDAKKRLDDLYKVSKGLMRLNARDLNNPSGSARAVIGGMDAPGGILSKLYRTTSRVAAGGAAGGGASSMFDMGVMGTALGGAVGGISSMLGAAKTKATQAADAMLSSPAFQEAMQRYINGNSQAANSVLNKLKATTTWLTNQPPEVRRAVARQGLIQYLTTTEQAQADDTD